MISRKTLVQLIELARLAPSMRNQQALKFALSYEPYKNNLIFGALKWAAALKDWNGPRDAERPAAYIVILGDTRITRDYGPDHGIAAQNILLGAVEQGLGGCMIGSIDRTLLAKSLGMPSYLEILLVVALGKPAEKIILEDSKEGDVMYYRDNKGYHHVPKRKIEDLIIN